MLQVLEIFPPYLLLCHLPKTPLLISEVYQGFIIWYQAYIHEAPFRRMLTTRLLNQGLGLYFKAFFDILIYILKVIHSIILVHCF